MLVWRLQSSHYPLINSEGARLAGGRWNEEGIPVIYASETIVLAALELIVHHGGIPEDHVGIRIDIPDDIEIQGTGWVEACHQAVLPVPSATMSISGCNYVLNPAHPDFARISFSFEPIRFDPRLHST